MNYASQAVQGQVLQILKPGEIWEDRVIEDQEQEEEMNLNEILLQLKCFACQLNHLLGDRL